jgi:predicted ATPase/DNA-binding SARP family transcriptional activator
MSENAAQPLTIRLFGAFHVLCAGRPLPPLRSQKGKWLLALLVLQRGREIQRGWLADVLWPDSDRAQSSLNTSLFDLRQALGGASTRLVAGRRTLRLDLAGADVDVVTFDAAMTGGDLAALREAVSLYTGPLLTGCSESWVAQHREHYANVMITALETLATQALADGDRETGIDCLRRAATVEFVREKTYLWLMQVLAESSDYTGAMQVYLDLRQRLQSELSRAPEEATTALYLHIRQMAHRRATTSPPTPNALQETADSPPSHIPQPLTALIGREQELQLVIARILSVRLLTLTGTGGVGKTRLAMEAAQQLAADFAHGAHLVALDAITDPTLLAQQTARILGVEASSGQTWHEALLDFLRPRQLLIVLDNCEHLIDACANLSRALLGVCPGLRILATSRERIGLTGESLWLVPPLPLPDSVEPFTLQPHRNSYLNPQTPSTEHPTPNTKHRTSEHLNTRTPVPPLTLQQCLDNPAIRLFCERAVSSRATFALSLTNVAAVIEICRRLDGLPLAIELAAALLESLSVHDITARLDDRFQLLENGDRTAPIRHQALEATLNWSYDRLTPAKQALLCRLCVFAGGWTLSAAEALCPLPPDHRSSALTLLSHLVSKSLVFVMGETTGDKTATGSKL